MLDIFLQHSKHFEIFFLLKMETLTGNFSNSFTVCQEMEEEVNVHHEELMKTKSCDTILSNQVQRLLMCFDIYLETEAAGSEEEGPMEISKEKIYNRMLRCVLY